MNRKQPAAGVLTHENTATRQFTVNIMNILWTSR